MTDPSSDETAPLTRRQAREAANATERPTLPGDAARGVVARDGAEAPAPATLAETAARTTPTTDPAQGKPAAAGLEDLFVPENVVEPKPRRRGRGCLVVLVLLLAIAGGIAIGGVWVANTYGERISAFFGWDGPSDYEAGEATGEAVITIEEGDGGEAISQTLYDAGVTLKPDSFYDHLIDAGAVPTFYPGVYQLQQKMTSEAALAALEDPESKLENTVLITEGSFAEDALENIASVTEVPLEDLQAEAADYTKYGVPAEAPSIEGFLFPATYTFPPEATAEDVIRTLVDEMNERLDALGVAEADRFETLTMAALVQRESGGDDDMAKIARVFYNRIDQGMLLQSDATVAYGAGSTHTVWTTDEQRADASNPYNTYVHEGLPAGPIGLPGESAIRAAADPAEGDWLYFVPVNLATGETVFSSTLAEHEAAVARLQAWCQESEENAAYCE